MKRKGHNPEPNKPHAAAPSMSSTLSTPSASSAPAKPAKAPRPRKPWWRRWLRRLIWTLVIFLVVVLLIVALIPTLVSAGWVRRLGAKQASQFLGRPIVLQRLDLSWSGRFELDGLSVGPLPGEPPQPLFALDKVRVRWGWKPLFSAKVRLDECRVEGLRATVARSKDGVLNLTRILPPSPPKAPEPPAPPKPPGKPLTELPIEAIHIALADFRVDYIDDATTRPMRADFTLDNMTIDLPSATAPLAIAMNASTRLNNQEPLPMSMTTTVTPGPRGYLAWQDIAARLDYTFASLNTKLAVDPRPSDAGFDVRVDSRVEPKPIFEYAASGLGIALPVALESGVVRATVNASWDGATSASLRVEKTFDNLAVSGPMLGPRPLRIEPLRFALAAGTVPADAPFSAFELHNMSMDCAYIHAFASGRADGLAAGGSPRGSLRWRIEQNPASVKPILDALGIALPPQADVLRHVQITGDAAGGLDIPASVIVDVALDLVSLNHGQDAHATGNLGRDAQAAGAAPPETTARLGIHNAVSFDLKGDDVRADVTVGEAGEEPWVEVRSHVHPVIAADRAGEVRVVTRPGPALDRVVALGLAPAAFVTTGTIAVDTDFSLAAAGDIQAKVHIAGDVGATPDLAAQPPLFLGMDSILPAAVGMRAVDIDFARRASGAMYVGLMTDVTLHGGYRVPPATKGAPPLDARVTLPVRGSLEVAVSRLLDIDFRKDFQLDPRLQLTGLFDLDKTESIHSAADLSYHVATNSLDLRSYEVAVGQWLAVKARAAVANLGKDKIDADLTTRVVFGPEVLTWVPTQIPMMGLDIQGATNVHVGAAGHWNPDAPADGVKARLEVDSRFDRMSLGENLGRDAQATGTPPLVNGRDWRFRLAVAGAASPAELMQPVRVAAGADIAHVDAMNMVSLQDFAATLGVDFDPRGPMTARWDANAAIGAVAAAAGPIPVALEDIRMGTAGRADVNPLAAQIDSAFLNISNLAELSAEARFTSATQTFDVSASARLNRLREWLKMPFLSVDRMEEEPPEGIVWESGPQTREILGLLRGLPTIDGSVGGRIAARGRVPTPDNIRRLDLPLRATVEGFAEDIATTLTTPVALTLRDLDSRLLLDTEGTSATTRVSGGLTDLALKSPLPLAISAIRWRSTTRLDWNAGRATLDDTALELPDFGVTTTADASVNGWADVVKTLANLPKTASETPKENFGQDAQAALDPLALARALILHMRGGLVFDSPDGLALPAAPSVRLQGRAEAFTQLRQEPDRDLEATAGLRVANLGATIGDSVRVSGVDGGLDMLLSGRRGVASSSASAAGPTSFLTDRLFTGLLSMLDFGDTMRSDVAPARPDQTSRLLIREIAVSPWTVRDLALTSEGDVRRWTARVDCNDLMGGRLNGALSLRQEPAAAGPASSAGAHDWTLGLRGEITGVSGRAAVPAWRDLPPAETEINALMDIAWHISRSAQTPEELVRGLDVRIVVTRIGPKALQGFLLALDPDEKNPTFVSARQGLAFGRPSYLRIALNHGMLDVEIGLTTFAGAGLTIPVLKRAAVGEVLRLETLRPQLEALLLVRDGLDSLSLLDRWVTPGETISLPGDKNHANLSK